MMPKPGGSLGESERSCGEDTIVSPRPAEWGPRERGLQRGKFFPVGKRTRGRGEDFRSAPRFDPFSQSRNRGFRALSFSSPRRPLTGVKTQLPREASDKCSIWEASPFEQ